MSIQSIQTREAPQANGPYSQAVRAAELVFISGQIGVDPTTGRICAEGIREQTFQVLTNIKAIIGAAGGSASNIIKCTVFLTDLALFPELNEVYEEFFRPPFPARSTVEVSRLPKDVLVEIEAVAVINGI